MSCLNILRPHGRALTLDCQPPPLEYQTDPQLPMRQTPAQKVHRDLQATIPGPNQLLMKTNHG